MIDAPDSTQLPRGGITGLRIVHFMLMAGIMLFTVLAYLFASSTVADEVAVTEPDLTLTWVAALFITAVLPLAFVVRARLFRRCSEIEDDHLAFQQFAAGSLVFAAILESSAIVALAMTFVQGQFTPTGWLVAVPLLAMALGIPFEDQFAGLRRLR